MQKLRKLSNERKMVCTQNTENPSISLPNDIIYLLTAHLNIRTQISRRRVGSRERSQKNENTLIHSSPHAFCTDLRPYSALEHVEVEKARKVYTSCFRNIRLSSLTLRDVKNLVLDLAENAEIFSLRISDCEMSFEDFQKLALCIRPRSLTLDNLRIANRSALDGSEVVNFFKSLNLLQFRVSSGGVSHDEFREIVAGINNYAWTNASYGYCHLRGGIGMTRFCIRIDDVNTANLYAGDNDIPDESTDYLCVYNAPLGKLSSSFFERAKRLKYLKLRDIAINRADVGRLPDTILGISIEACWFDKFAFYDLLRKLSKSLRYIYFAQTELPLDSVSFIHRTLKSCQIDFQQAQ